MSKNIAIILAGCGYLDGAEIRESVLTLLALDTEGARYDIFAPDRDQHHVINHLSGEEVKESRNVLMESARIARGKIQDLKELDSSKYDALILPGGFGAAKNLSDFAFKGSDGKVSSDVAKTIKDFNSTNKTIGAICISPALLALALGDKKPNITIGNDESTASELQKLGAVHANTAPNEIIVDETNKLVTTAAYMFDDAPLNDIFTGIHSLVKKVIEL
ncbi:MAG: isoprenoid biosynthesis protein ElbB [Halobacteriovorax sp.]|nr:isoprenoid biosynthesis protein ElbB [Halobacteriovorax sp.]|tara:strand:+ start:1199 stop:1855 length:657 start_codon:yes stop_codon:yes gene_type:complete